MTTANAATGPTPIACLPVPVLGLTNVAAISGGWEATLALLSNGTVWAWGLNGNGELGDGTTNTRYSPVQVVGLSNIISVWEGDQNSMALRADGTVWKWGENQYGEQGNGTIRRRHRRPSHSATSARLEQHRRRRLPGLP